MSQPSPPVPIPEVYSAVAARRTQFDNLVWQVPALSITAQAFLFTISLGPDTRPVARVIACLLSLVATFLAIQLFTRQRQAEITDAHWLEEYEGRHKLQPGAHGLHWQKLREQTSPQAGLFNSLAKLRGYPTWAAGLSMFGIASLAVLVISIGWPQLLER